MAFFWFENTQDYYYYFVLTVKDEKHNFVYKKVWTNYSFEQFNKWKWYFEYRCALAKVNNPKYKIETSFGKAIKSIPDLEKNKKNKIIACKRKITEMKNKINLILSQESKELFSLEEHPKMIAFKKKLKEKEEELSKYEEYDLEDFSKNSRFKAIDENSNQENSFNIKIKE